MTRSHLNSVFAFCLCLCLQTSQTSCEAGTILGPAVYDSFVDSPFNATSFEYFYLETFEDGLFNVPGVTAIGSPTPLVATPASNVDSVDFGPGGHSFFTAGDPGITFNFSDVVLGQLPTHVGLVWTDGINSIVFEAFDSNGSLIGTVTGNHADGTFFSSKGEDRFYGAINLGGISRVTIRSGAGQGIEVDHLQYGAVADVPEPASWLLGLTGSAGFPWLRRRALWRRI